VALAFRPRHIVTNVSLFGGKAAQWEGTLQEVQRCVREEYDRRAWSVLDVAALAACTRSARRGVHQISHVLSRTRRTKAGKREDTTGRGASWPGRFFWNIYTTRWRVNSALKTSVFLPLQTA
jgi:hypothetical protein